MKVPVGMQVWLVIFALGASIKGEPAKRIDLTKGKKVVLEQNKPVTACIDIRLAKPSVKGQLHILADKSVTDIEQYKTGKLTLKWDGEIVKCGSPTGCTIDQNLFTSGIHKLTIATPDEEFRIWRFEVEWGSAGSNIGEVKEVPCK